MQPELSRELGRILGQRPVGLTERQKIADAAMTAGSWEKLPQDIKDLVAEIQARPMPDVS